MRVTREFEEVRVYDGVAERTGALVDHNSVRRSPACCRSLSELFRKARESGDGTFYLAPGLWPADQTHLEVRKPWVVVSSHP